MTDIEQNNKLTVPVLLQELAVRREEHHLYITLIPAKLCREADYACVVITYGVY